MAPQCTDPRQVVIALNPARRQALLKLIDEIISYMLSQLDSPIENLGPVDVPESENPSYSQEKDKEASKSEQKPIKGEGRPEPRFERTPSGGTAVTKAPLKDASSIQKAARAHMEAWKDEFVPKLMEIVGVQDDDKITNERQKRKDAMEKKKLSTPDEGEHLMSFGEVKIDKSEDTAALQALYHPIPTRLTTIPSEDRKECLSCILLLLLSTGKYSAHSRALALYLASALELPQAFLIQEETEIAVSLMENSTKDESQKEAMSAEAETAKRQQENKFSRYWKVGLASVAGATIIGVTGGLAAPLVAGAIGGIMGGVGLGGVASFLGVFWMNGALVGALFGAYGAKMTGELMDKYAKEVEDFKFIPLADEWGKEYTKKRTGEPDHDRRLRVTIGINGWLNDEEDVTRPWRVLGTDSEVFALRYEMKTLLSLGTAFGDLIKSVAWKTFKSEIIKRTVLATLWAALWPLQLLAMATNVDNPYNHASNRSRKAGELLADALINRVQGERPVTLIGYSLGAHAIHACLQALAERQAFGLIDTVVIIGTPAPADSAHWRTLRSVVSGKIFNVYSENDMILGFLYRMHSLSMGVAGLEAIKEVEGIENLDLSDRVSGHLRYPEITGEILKKCAFVGVKGGTSIEKDDVIILKDQHAEGKLVDFENLDKEQPQPEKEDKKTREISNDLRDLNISPPALAPSKPPRPPPQPADKPPRPSTPSTNASDDEGYQGISLQNNASDTE